MGSTVKDGVIWISKDLAAKITSKERKIILAHEVSHWRHKDNDTMVFIRILFFWFPAIINYFSRRFEMRADKEAIKMTKDPDSFLTLLDKLGERGKGHPQLFDSIELANTMRGKT